MNINIQLRWNLYKLLNRNITELIRLERSINDSLTANDISNCIKELDRIYQNLLIGLTDFPSQALNDLRFFARPDATLSVGFINQRITRLRALIQPFSREVGYDLNANSKSYLWLLVYFIVSYRKIFIPGTISLFLISSLISIFSSDIRGYILKNSAIVRDLLKLEEKSSN